MSYLEIPFSITKSYEQLKQTYDIIGLDIIGKEGAINIKDYKFNNYIGDITKDIRWTWAINKASIGLFEKIIEPFKDIIDDYFKNEFTIYGASFITLYEKEVINSVFHYDIISHYDIPLETNTITLIFPLYIEEGMGSLEYKENKQTKVYNYKKDNIFIWDACKLEHRTQPYRLSEKKKRVLVSINLASNKEWAIEIVKKSLQCQGNLLV